MSWANFSLCTSCEPRVPWFCAGGRFLSAYQIMTALAIYLMATAVMDQSSAFMLNHQTRMLLSIGVRTSHEVRTTT